MTGRSNASSEMPPAIAHASLVFAGYQDGPIVSRVLLKRGGTVLEGEAEIVLSGATVHVSRGEMILMPANQPHAVSARTRFKMLLTTVGSA